MATRGSSVINGLMGSGATGPTGPTGPTGATGPVGFGLTGPTGSNVVGITLTNRFLVTSFSDGSTYSTLVQIYGATGNASYLLAISNIGTGVSLGYGVTGNNIQTRPIRFVNSSNTTFTVTDNTTSVDVNLLSSASGVTLPVSASTDRNLITFGSTGLPQRVSNTFGVTLPSDPTNVGVESVTFVSANIFELVRGGGWTGSTAAINSIGSGSGITCTINPTIAEFDGQMYGSSSRVFVADFRGSTGTIVVSDPPNDKRVYGFDLILSGALNPDILTNRFSSNVKWSLNRTPCFSFGTGAPGLTCDMKISFFGLGGTTAWYASAIPTSSRCNTKQLFDIDCIPQLNFLPPSGSLSLGSTGACCGVDGSCTEMYADNCVGFFHGIGTTCGATYDSICDKVGACCVFEVDYNCYDYLTCTECLALGISGSVTTQFAGKYTTCNDVDCTVLSTNTSTT
jgi:hypothetical protein